MFSAFSAFSAVNALSEASYAPRTPRQPQPLLCKAGDSQVAADAGAAGGKPTAPVVGKISGIVGGEGRRDFSTSSANQTTTLDAAVVDETNVASEPPAAPGSDTQLPTAAQIAPTMVIRNGAASVEVEKLNPAIVKLRQLATQLGGYVANSSMSSGRDQIPSATLEQRLIDLLATRTGKLQDVLSVERELARVRELIERYEGRLRYLKSRASISTLSVTVHEPLAILGQGPGQNPIVAAIRQAWRNFVGFISAGIALLGVLIPVGALALVGWVVYRRFRGKLK